MRLCSTEVAGLLTKSIQHAEVCMEHHYIDFEQDLDHFRRSRQEWHAGFDRLLDEVAKDYKSLISDENYTGHCQNRYPIIVFVSNITFLFILVCSFGYFIFQDATTSFGASRSEIFVAVNILVVFGTILAAFTFPALNLLRVAVRLSVTLEECVLQLKALQRQVIHWQMDLDLYNLHASIWDGVTFGVREPVFNYIINKDFEDWLVRRIYVLIMVSCCIVLYLLYRSNVKSLLQWRKAIPSVVCIGVTFPGSKEPQKLWRLGSGCIVSSSRGLILTNWHLFQRMGSDEELYQQQRQYDGTGSILRGGGDLFETWSAGSGTPHHGNHSDLFRSTTTATSHAYHNSTSEDAMESMRRSLQALRQETTTTTAAAAPQSTQSLWNHHPSSATRKDNDDEEGEEEDGEGVVMDEFGVPMPKHLPNHALSSPAVLQQNVHRHLVHANQYAEPLQEKFPEMRIYIGTATRGHPHWQYEAEFTSVESPSSEFTPFGLDLLLLKITRKVGFEGLKFSESGPSASESMHAFTYSFDDVRTVQEGDAFDLRSERLVKLEIGNPFKLFPTDKLRLLGFPASGGYSLSVLTTYFTSISFDYPSNLRGAWVNVNTQLPSGGSGGAAVNAQGQLVGISTQTKGELTNIRSITEAKHLIQKAKRDVDRARMQLERERNAESTGATPLTRACSLPVDCSFALRQSLFL